MSWIQLKQHFDGVEAFVNENTMCDVQMANGISMVIRLIIRWQFVIHTAIESDTVFDCFRMNAKLMKYPQGLEVIMVSRMWVWPV